MWHTVNLQNYTSVNFHESALELVWCLSMILMFTPQYFHILSLLNCHVCWQHRSDNQVCYMNNLCFLIWQHNKYVSTYGTIIIVIRHLIYHLKSIMPRAKNSLAMPAQCTFISLCAWPPKYVPKDKKWSNNSTFHTYKHRNTGDFGFLCIKRTMLVINFHTCNLQLFRKNTKVKYLWIFLDLQQNP